jgi:beta-N-acetylhexosaminidase
VRVGSEAVVVRLEAPRSIAAGDVPWGVATSLAARGVKVTATQDLDAPAGTSLVLVVRDLHRLPEQRQVIEGLLARRPDAILVEMGVPACRPAAARAYIATHGSARVCADAAAELMAQ